MAFGPPGSGKTHLVCALGRELIYQRRREYNCSTLVQELLWAKQQLRLPRLLKRLSRFEALIIDDIGYVQHSRQEMDVLFVFLSQRYEQGSVLLTSNLALGAHLQGPDDDGCGHRPIGTLQRDSGAERAQLPLGGLQAAPGGRDRSPDHCGSCILRRGVSTLRQFRTLGKLGHPCQ